MSLLGPRVPQTKHALQQEPSNDDTLKLTLLELPALPVSLARQIRIAWREQRSVQSLSTGTPLPILDMKPWFRNLPEQIRTLLTARRGGSTVFTLRPVAVRDLWQDYRQDPFSWANSALIHLVVVTAILLPSALPNLLKPPPIPRKLFDLTPLVLRLPPLHGHADKTSGGGGGGDRSPLPASRGALPQFALTQFAPPRVIIPKVPPLLPMQATLIGPPEIKLPAMKLDMAWGDPRGVPGPPSQGPGTGGGIGDGKGTGVGPGDGSGAGPGSDGGCCGDTFQVGRGGVSSPVAIFSPEPTYSEEARKAKFGGIVLLWIVVDAQGNVQNVRIAKPLGMGLDEQAVKTVSTWKFKPALHQGVPMPVQVQVEVSFRLF